MSAAWEDMTDIERAAALELMGGKRQANILSSVIQNFETVEDVIETSMNSSGSAIAENEKWLDSIEGKTYQFTNALQGMWSSIIDSEVAKSFIDFGTDAVRFLETGTGKVIALVAALKLVSKFKGFSIGGLFKGIGTSIQNVTIASQKLQALSSVTSIAPGTSLSTESVNAYAAAVAGLTAKQQANLLASQNLTKQDIQRVLQTNQCTEAEQREAMAHVHTSTTKQQEAAASQALFAIQTQELAMSYQNTAADLTEANAEQAKLAAKILSEAASKNLTRAELLEKITQSSLTEETKKQIIAKLGLTTANEGLAASMKALMTANPVGFWITVGTTILSLIPMLGDLVGAFEKSAEEIKQEAQEISQAYEDAVNEVNNNLQSLGVTNDSALIGALEKEFATLTAGVDRYGNNLSLTSDQYERYRDICEQIVGINPLIAKGYDSATEAIGNNASVLSQLIELQEMQARSAAQEFIKDENLEILSADVINEYNTAISKSGSLRAEAMSNIYSILAEAINNAPDKPDGQYTGGLGNKKVAQWTLEQIGYTKELAAEISNQYYAAGTDIFNTSAFLNDHLDEISANISKFGPSYAGALLKSCNDAESKFEEARATLEKAKDGLIETLLVAPVSSGNYNKLTSSGKNFLVDWIKNNEMFKVDDELTDEQVKAMKESILNMMDILVSDAKNIEYNGEKFTAQELLSKIYNLDPSSVNYEDYKKQINELLTAFWNSLTADQKKEYGFDKFEDFTISLGFNFVADEKSESIMISRYAKIKGITEEEARKYFESLPAVVVKRLLAVDWNTVDENNVDDTIQNAKGKQSSIISSKTYSVLSESVEAYNEVLSKTSEITADNTEVTQEYKDSLADLGISQEELNECFDDANPLIVKNSKALNKLVKASSKNIATNVKLAKSNARLEYYDLVKQLNSTLNGTKKLDGATRDAVYSTLAQIDAVQKALYQYQLLEDTLLGVNNAFKDFNDAKEIDALNTYGDSYVEMVQTMYDGLFKTGQVGTEQFWAAVEHLVPDEVYQGLKEDSDRMKAIYDYYNKNILPSLRLKDDQFSMDYDSIENFVNKAIDAGVFAGNRKDFDLVEGMNLEKAAELMGMTTAQAYAFFAELDKYNTSSTEPSFLLQLDDSLEGRITKITNNVEDLNKQKLALLEDGGYEKNKDAIDDINSKLTQSEAELREVGQEAYNTWQEYTKVDAAIAALSEVEDKTAQISKHGAIALGLKWDDVQGQTVQQVLDSLLAKQLELEEPTVLTAQLAIDNIDSQIDALKQKLKQSEQDPTVLGVKADADQATIDAAKQKIEDQIQALEEDKVVLSTTFGIELSEEEKKDLEEELNAIEKFTINDKEFAVTATNTSETMQTLRNINDYTIGNKSYTVTTRYQTIGSGKDATVRVPFSGGRYTQANGTAHANGSWGAPKTEAALVGELGPEMLVRNGRWTTIGDNGAEFTQIKKGDIIFNHKQTEDLLKNGYVTSRGKAYASGTAYSGTWRPVSPGGGNNNNPGDDFSGIGDRLFDAADSLSGAAGGISDAADEFREVFDWVEVRLEEINEELELGAAMLENAIGSSEQNSIIDEMLELTKKLYDNLIAGANKYYAYAETLLAKVPEEYRKAAQDGSIAIETFAGEVDEKTLEAIQEYREWVQKGADATQQAEEALAEIRQLAKQAIDNIADEYDNKTSLHDSKIDQYEAYNDYLETDTGFESADIYAAMIEEANAKIAALQEQRNKMQEELNKRVESGEIEVGSQEWYDAINAIAEVDTEIINLKTDTENWQDAINELHWEKFDALMGRLEAVAEEAGNLIDILSNKDLFDESGNWTDEGIASLGLYAQQMEAAEAQAKKYQEEIDYLNANWQALGYTEEEYLAKLEELKSGQYDAIKAYHESKDAIVDLNKERIDAIKNGIEEEIKAYSELIDKKKEELDAEKDLHDFQKSVMEQEKDIADIERQLAALAGDNSASARAKRAQLEAELAEAKAALEDSYYDRSVSNQQEALDKELENFQDEKDKEMEGWDEYLKNTEQVVADSLATVQANTDAVYQVLQEMAQEYGLNIENSITSSIIDPWSQGSTAIQSFSEQFGISMSATVEELKKLEEEFLATMQVIEQAGSDAVLTVENNAKGYTEATKQEPEGGGSGEGSGESPNAGLVSSLPGYIQYGHVGENVKKLQQALNDLGYGNSGTSGMDGIFGDKTFAAVKAFQRDMGISADGIVGPDTKKKFKLKGYKFGSEYINKDQLSVIDELGEELIVRAKNGRITYLEKGSGVVPADLTKNIMGWGRLDPQIMLDQNRPHIQLQPNVETTEIRLDNSVGELIHIEHCDQGTLPDVEKIVNKALEKHTQRLNQSLRKFAR